MKKIIFMMYQNLEKYGYSDFQFISSWETNYKSWKFKNKYL